MGGLNVHPSLLPKYRGSSPIQYTILNKDSKSGVSIIGLCTKSFDSGSILEQRVIDIDYPVEFTQLHDKLANLGSLALIDTLRNFDEKFKSATIQNESEVSKAPKLSPSDSEICWHNESADRIFRLYNALGNKVLNNYF